MVTIWNDLIYLLIYWHSSPIENISSWTTGQSSVSSLQYPSAWDVEETQQIIRRINRMKEMGISLEAVSPLYKTLSNSVRHRNCCRIPEAWTCVWLKEQNKMSEDRLVGCAGPPDWICDVAVKLGLTLPFWGMLEGPWKKPAWQWLSQQNKEGSYFLEDFRTSVS